MERAARVQTEGAQRTGPGPSAGALVDVVAVEAVAGEALDARARALRSRAAAAAYAYGVCVAPPPRRAAGACG